MTDAAGISSGWPLVVVALLLLANGVLCWRAARSANPTTPALRNLAEVDAVFTVAVLWFALASPTDAEAWLRMLVTGLAAIVAAVAVIKLILAGRLDITRTTLTS